MVRSYKTGSKPHIFLWICSTISDGRWLGDSSTTTLLFNSIIAMHFLEKSVFFYFCLSFNFFVFFPFFLFFPFPLLSTCFYLYLLSFANFIFFVYFCLFLSIFRPILQYYHSRCNNSLTIWVVELNLLEKSTSNHKNRIRICEFSIKNYTIYVFFRRV